MNQAASPARHSAFPFRRMALDFRYACIINLVCALFTTYVIGSDRDFWVNLVASMCIGTIAFLIIDGVRLSLWRDKGSPTWQLFLLILVTVPVAQMAGLSLFGWIMGIDVSKFGNVDSPNILGSLLFTLTASGCGALFFFHRETMLRLEAAAAQEKARTELISRQALQAQLQLLQAQIEPHMLFNTLANLQGLIGFDPERAQLLLDHLIQYLRATLSSSRAQATTLAQEFALMEAYLGLMSIRMGQRLSYTVHLPKELSRLDVPPMLLQPLVENAIQHGLEPKIDGGHIDVSASSDSATLVLTVIDSGLGLNHPRQSRQGSHVGLSNIRERLQALHGAQASFSLTDGAPSGAIARLTLPMTTP